MTLVYQFLDNPLFGVTLTVGALILFQILFKKTKNPLLNPLIFAIIGIIAFLKITGIPYESYAKGGNIISFFLGPVTVALAVPLYKQFDKLKANAVPILISITTGVVVAIVSTVLMGRAFGLSPEMIASLAPKATTTAIAMDLSATMGGDPALTVAFVVVAGTTGFIIGEQVLTLLKIKSKTAKGIGLGTSAHAFGTNRALLMGEEEGAMSSLAIGVAGIITTFLLPILIKILM
ncbi:LrgB family protein [Erysipelothrix tonsillarum]|uniref:LrgB family protein n=1 Tax=Erysipelothrix tonsillarum TaxID=38402 RepID=UPI00036706BB|nr:LrgB family protein [Erysipelothrix tonsillarum]